MIILTLKIKCIGRMSKSLQNVIPMEHVWLEEGLDLAHHELIFVLNSSVQTYEVQIAVH